MNQKGSSSLLILVAVLIILGLSGYYYIHTQNDISYNLNPAPTPTLDATANWKTYKNSEFEFRYPTHGEIVTENPSTVYISANTQPYYTFTVKTEDNPNKLTAQQVVDKVVSDLRNDKDAPWAKSQADMLQKTAKTYTNGQIDGIKLQSFDEGYPGAFGEVVQVKGDKIYHFYIGDGSGASVTEVDEKKLDQILSTFKFTGSDPTINCGQANNAANDGCPGDSICVTTDGKYTAGGPGICQKISPTK